jgi:hypothetical protein
VAQLLDFFLTDWFDPSAFRLFFAAGYYTVEGEEVELSDVLDYSRTGTAWAIEPTDYSLLTFPAGQAPITSGGLGIWDASTNIYPNSDAPATATITVTDATEYTLSVWSSDGTGSAEVAAGGSGTATGNWRDQNHLTFTSTATSVTVTLSGTVDWIQLEERPDPTEYIHNNGTGTTSRSGVSGSEGKALLAGLLNDTEGTIVVDAACNGADALLTITQIDDGNNTGNRHLVYWPDASIGRTRGLAQAGGLTTAQPSFTDVSTITGVNLAYSYKQDDFEYYANGSLADTDNSGAVPTGLSRITFGIISTNTAPLNGELKEARYYDTANAATQ